LGKGEQDLFKYLPPVKDYIFTESVRGGLESIVELLFAGNPGKVLLPVFIAEGVIRPFRNKNVEIVFYKITSDLDPDIVDVKTQIVKNPDIKVMVVLHYFGFAYDFSQVRNICSNNKIYLFEDCVHALFSKNKKDGYLGTTGDISFFSLPKVLPVPDGAIFFINNPELIYIKSSLKYKRSFSGHLMIALHLIYLLLKNIEVALSYSFLYRLINAFTKINYGLYYVLLNWSPKPQAVSGFTLRILKNINYDDLIAKRKNHIKNIYNSLDQSNNNQLFKPFDSNLVLTGVPFISKDSNVFMANLKRNNIESLTYKKRWLFTPVEDETRFKSEMYFVNHHFLLPIHENDTDYSQELKMLIST
jgi:perosamine synthetase